MTCTGSSSSFCSVSTPRNKSLRPAARPLTRHEILQDDIQRLIRDMIDTMQDAPGVGLAAPQIGLSLQLAVIEDREGLLRSC
jgi:peptide deformylase